VTSAPQAGSGHAGGGVEDAGFLVNRAVLGDCRLTTVLDIKDGDPMEIGIDSFAARPVGGNANTAVSSGDALAELLDRIQFADQIGLDVFGIGEHYRAEFLDSAPAVILAAAAARTKRIRLTSAVSVLSTVDPVRLFQNFSTLDLISDGRAEMVVGRGSSIESFPLFGLDLEDYDALFSEKLELLLTLRENEVVNWSGKFRPELVDQPIYPRPLQDLIPIWLGVGGTPASFARAGTLGLPLMVAVIGGETHRFRPLVDLYRRAGEEAGHSPEDLRVGLHSLGYVGNTSEEAIADFFPGHARTFTRLGRERGFPPVTRTRFDAETGPTGALIVGDPEDVARKILRHSEALGGISRVTFQMDGAELSHEQLLRSYELIGTRVAPLLESEAL
jgi:probable LLM family oxidoreductase